MQYYVTSPIYYVNDNPHIGHAYTNIICDIIARYHKLTGKNVTFMTGTDEHGQKIQKSAQKANTSCQEFVDTISEKFRDLATKINASNNLFLRTTSEQHKTVVLQLWNMLFDTKNIYLGSYSGWYSTRDEAFYDEKELTEDGLAPTGAQVEWLEEPCYFFALSKWEKPLLEFYEKNPDFVKPISRFNEVISFVKSGLKDLAVSRTSIDWGIKVPQDPKHVIYVWLDALTCYISSINYFENNHENKQTPWPADVQVVGKDILIFHAVYWPAFLMAANIQPAKQVLAHGWWTNEGQKISKSLGNVIDPVNLIDEFGLDYVRYFLIREISVGNDGNFSRANLISRVNTELNNNIGNLIQRTLALVYKNGEIENDADDLYNEELLKLATKLPDSIAGFMKNFELHLAIEAILRLSDEANKYIDSQAPWKLFKTDEKRAKKVLGVIVETIRYIAIALGPFIPESSDKILNQILGQNSTTMENRNFDYLSKKYAITNFKLTHEPQTVFSKL